MAIPRVAISSSESTGRCRIASPSHYRSEAKRQSRPRIWPSRVPKYRAGPAALDATGMRAKDDGSEELPSQGVTSEQGGSEKGKESGRGVNNSQDSGSQDSCRNRVDAEDDTHPDPEVRLREPLHCHDARGSGETLRTANGPTPWGRGCSTGDNPGGAIPPELNAKRPTTHGTFRSPSSPVEVGGDATARR